MLVPAVSCWTTGVKSYLQHSSAGLYVAARTNNLSVWSPQCYNHRDTEGRVSTGVSVMDSLLRSQQLAMLSSYTVEMTSLCPVTKDCMTEPYTGLNADWLLVSPLLQQRENDDKEFNI